MGKRKKVLIVHNYYQIPGGEDTVVANEKELLENHGYRVILYTRNNSEMKEFSFLKKLFLPVTSVFSLRTYRDIKRIIKEQKINVVHVHNTLSLISSSVYYAALSLRVPVVQTLHNYRLICANGLLYRGGHICEECVKAGCRCAVRHSCYRGSKLQTIMNILIVKVHKLFGIYNKLNFVCLTDFQKKKLMPYFPKAKFFVKPHFSCPTESQSLSEPESESLEEYKGGFYLYVGRMEKNKGVWVLLKAFEKLTNLTLLLVGSGAEEEKIKKYLQEKNMRNVQYCGQKSREWVMSRLACAKALIQPSQCYETFGMTVIESFSCGTPAIASDIAVFADFVKGQGTGLIFRHDSPNDLQEKVLYIEENPDFQKQAGEQARRMWKERYSPEGNFRQLEKIYSQVQRDRRRCWHAHSATAVRVKKDKKKRVVIITNIPSPYRVDLFYYLQEHAKEYEIHILYASRTEDNRSWELEKQKMKNSHFLDSYTIKIPGRYDTKYIHISRGVKAVLEELQPAIVVGAEYNPTVIKALGYCRKKKIPYISWTDGTLHSERNINPMQKWLRKYVIRHAAAYLASSSKSKEAQVAYGADKERCFISFLTVDLDKYLVLPKERKENRILCVGSLIERKGIDLLLNALAGIQSDYTLAIAGSGPEEENLKRLSGELGIEKRVEFLGYLCQKDLKNEYAKSSIFVLPTREDCFALVILEAMCASLPVVCSKYADGAYDLIEEEENGYLIDPYDTEKFGECLKGLLEDPGQAEKMGEKSLKNLGRFRFDQVSRGFWDAFSYVGGKIL